MGKLDSKVALITGAGSGFGRATAMLFVEEGAKVVVVDCAAAAGEETVRMIKAAGGEAIFVNADVSKTDDVKRMISTTTGTYGKLDILFSNAGVCGSYAPLTKMAEEQWDKTLSIDLKGVWLGMKYGIPVMLGSGGGVVINMASMSGFTVAAGIPADYNVAKAGVIMLTKTAAAEFAPKIRVNCICPGHCLTPQMEQWVHGDKKALEQASRMSLMGRLGKAEEIAQAALFLASDESSSYITGEALVIDGGHTVVARGEVNL